MLENLRSLSTSAKQYLKTPHNGGSDESRKIMYNVAITTGGMKFAGTDANVYFSITGIGGDKTSRIKLDNAFRDDFERGTTDKFRVKLEDIGTPTLVILQVDHLGLFADWFASRVTVQKSGHKEVYEFPVYSWIEGVAVAPCGTACLPQDEQNLVVLGYRKDELSRRRHLYKWRRKDDHKAKGLPGYIAATNHKGLPRNMQLTDGLYKDFEESKGIVSMQAVQSKGIVFMNAVQNKVHAIAGDGEERWESFEEIWRFLSNPKFPKIPGFQNNWLKDEEFGRQMIAGCNPNIIKRCKKIQDNFPVTENVMKKFLDPGKSLQDEIKRGKVFIVDCAIAKDITSANSCVPMCLLYQGMDGKLKPIAIQLQQKPGHENPVWTPNDSQHDWTLAKMYFRCAESSIQQVVYRLLYTHFILEPFAVGMMRCLCSQHPLFKLLYPHLQYVCASNTIARTSLLTQNGVFDRLLSYGIGGSLRLLERAYKTFDLSCLNVLNQLKDQGVDTLVNFYYRDDAVMLYKCVGKYVEKIVNAYYKTDVAVTKDTELQSFIKEVHTDGFAWEDGNARGCPKAFSRKIELVDVLTMVIFTASCQQSAMTSGQFDIFMHVPNAPFTMSKPPPTAKGTANLQTVIASLPSKRKSEAQFDFVHALSKIYEDEVYLGEFHSKLFCDEEALKILGDFKKDLDNISKKIKERNAKLENPYEYLLPEKIPAGVTV